jgi:hypothetical protein
MTATHDYSITTWGHDYTIMSVEKGGKLLKIMGHGCRNTMCRPNPLERLVSEPRCRIEKGDFLILKSSGSSTTRYQVDAVEYLRDPKDMWEIEATFAPREFTP